MSFRGIDDVGLFEEGADELDFWIVEFYPGLWAVGAVCSDVDVESFAQIDKVLLSVEAKDWLISLYVWTVLSNN